MKLTRRNALIGLGTAAAGAGVVGGTGAFTSVEADRDVTISTTGDSGANVQIDVDPGNKHGNGLSGDPNGGGGTVQLNMENLNKNATTDYDDALGVTPNQASGNAGPYDLSARILDGSDGNNVAMATATVDDGNSITTGTEAYVDVKINLQDHGIGDFPSDTVIEISVDQAE